MNRNFPQSTWHVIMDLDDNSIVFGSMNKSEVDAKLAAGEYGSDKYNYVVLGNPEAEVRCFVSYTIRESSESTRVKNGVLTLNLNVLEMDNLTDQITDQTADYDLEHVISITRL